MGFETDLLRLLEAVHRGEVEPLAAARRLKALPFDDLGFAKLDHHRALRMGFPEVVFCPGKTPEHVARAVHRLAETHGVVLATRATAEQAAAAVAGCPDAAYDEVARAVWVDRRGAREDREGLVVVAAGTADLPLAEEAALTAT
jgi:NCAIR mutase (PurE)-related protein